MRTLPLTAFLVLVGCPEPTVTPPTGTEPTPDPADCVVLDAATVEAGTTLTAGCYRMSESMDITGDLVIEAGVTVFVDPNLYLEVDSGGSFAANGTETEPVVFRGETDTAGTWFGIGFDGSGSPSNVLSHLTIDGAGNDTWNGSNASTGALFIDSGSRVTMSNLTVIGAPDNGVNVWAADANVSLDGLTTSAVGVPLLLDIEQAGELSGVFTLAGDDPTIHLSGDLDDDITLGAYAYTVTETMTVGGDLVVTPGATIGFEQDLGLDVNGGSLNAAGTTADPIVFHGTEAVEGYWLGVHFENSNSADNVLSNVTIEHAGSDFWTGSDESKGSLYLAGDEVRLTVTDSLVHLGEGPGLVLEGDNPAGKISIASTTIDGCDEGIVATADATAAIGVDVLLTNNDDNHLRVALGNTLDESVTWPMRAYDYYVETTVNVLGDLTIEPGATVRFNDDVGLRAGSWPTAGGSITIGAATGPEVLLTGASPIVGYWRGLYFNETQTNSIQNTRIEFAGSSGWNGSDDSQAAVYVYTHSLVSIDDVTFADNERQDVFVSGSTVTGCANVVGTIDGDNDSTFCTF